MTLEEAYRSGYQAAMLTMPEIVRCKDCNYGKHIVSTVNGEVTLYRVFCVKPYVDPRDATHEPDWFCADGEREDSEQA